MDIRVTDIERTLVEVLHTPAAGRSMLRHIPGWTISEVLVLRTNVGLVGIGETIVHYTWSRVTDASVQEAIGKNPYDLLYRDDLGAGLQIALWDVAAKHASVPVHALLGQKVRDRVPLAWWCIDMPPEDWASEARDAIRQGYTSFKLKGRPWFDIVEQVRAVADVVPAGSPIDVDFNDFLLDADNALSVLKALEEIDNVEIFESPIPQGDVPGNVRLRSELKSQIAMHYGSPPFRVAVTEGACDGFVLCCGANAMLSQARAAAQVDMPFWIQLVGTGITTTWANHLGAVLTHAKWPAITCLNTYSEPLVVEPIRVSDGHVAVGDAPGLGIELDRDAVARLRVDAPDIRPSPRWVQTIRFGDGTRAHFRNYDDYVPYFRERKLPIGHRDVRLDVWFDDGSSEFAALFRRVCDGPVVERSA